jgi:hypothetical protein
MHRRLAVVLLILISARPGQSSERPTGRSRDALVVRHARHGRWRPRIRWPCRSA